MPAILAVKEPIESATAGVIQELDVGEMHMIFCAR